MIQQKLANKIIEVALLLIGLGILNILWLPFATLLFDSATWFVYLGIYQYWVGQIIFGVIIYFRIRDQRLATSIGLLSAMMPVTGSLFYLLADTIIGLKNDR